MWLVGIKESEVCEGSSQLSRLKNYNLFPSCRCQVDDIFDVTLLLIKQEHVFIFWIVFLLSWLPHDKNTDGISNYSSKREILFPLKLIIYAVQIKKCVKYVLH